MTLYLKGNEVFEALLNLCRLYKLTTPIIRLERFQNFDMWVVTIDNDEKEGKIIDRITNNRYSHNVLKIEANKGAQA